MSVYRIQYRDGKKMMLPVQNAEEYKDLRCSAGQLENLKAARSGDTDAKLRLVQFNYSCLPNADGSLKGATRVGNSVGMDIDHIAKADMEKTIDGILEKQEELGLMMLERSARGEGLHIVFRRHADKTNEQNLRWASDLLGVEFDKGAKDITRVFFGTSSNMNDLIFLSDELFDNTAYPIAAYPIPLPKGGAQIDLTAVGTETDVQNTAKASSSADAQVGTETERQKTAESTGSADASLTAVSSASADASVSAGPTVPLNYLGIPYSDILRKWWELNNSGQEPVTSNRDSLTFELAQNIRHICGFDRQLMDKVIPCYDGFPEAQKMKCIDSALSERMTPMPRRVKDVLNALHAEILKHAKTAALNGQNELAAAYAVTDAQLSEALDRVMAQDDLYHYDRLPKLPMGVSDSIEATGHTLAMAILIAIAPAIGALATGVKLDVHGEIRGLNLCSFIAGEFASGKGKIDRIIAAWMNELQAEANIYIQREDEWAQKVRCMKSGKAPEQPKLPVRMLTLNNTVANIAERLANTEGRHSFSFTPEADNVALRWKQSISDFSVMLRQAYDEARYDREAKSADAARVHIEKLLWNVTMCGTQDALYRVITNYTDGLLSRIAIARTPDNTYSPLDDTPAQLTEVQEEHIKQVAHLLPLMQGTIVLPKLEERGRQWLESIRLEAMKNDDRVLARQRMRGCVNAQRITVALWLPKVAETLIKKHGFIGAETQLKQNPELCVEMLRKLQSDDMMKLFDTLADYLIDNDLYYFRDRIEKAYEIGNSQNLENAVRSRKGKNDSIFSRLADEFTTEQALQQAVAIKGTSATNNSVHQMLKNWRNQGLITCINGKFKKVKEAGVSLVIGH